ncbi:unnamed protein product, partial [Urochloa humidicola]
TTARSFPIPTVSSSGCLRCEATERRKRRGREATERELIFFSGDDTGSMFFSVEDEIDEREPIFSSNDAELMRNGAASPP